jgi:hypothetical protein
MQRPRRPRQCQRQRQNPHLTPNWTDASCARYGSSLDSRPSACATSGTHLPNRDPSSKCIDTEKAFDRNECDPDGTGSLDRDAFARGMARIDEELRRAQVLGRANGAGWNAAGAARALRPVPSRPILR